jgi:glycosyltransferase involved in cell wall biosynthesis
MMESGVSVIICCYNGASRLQNTIRHLAEQKLPLSIKWEIIVINNASTDDTEAVAKAELEKYTFNNATLNIINEPIAGLSNARQRGINYARYEYLIFCDDDNWLDENYVHNVFKSFEEYPDAAILGGVGIPEFEDSASKPVWFDRLYHGYAVGPQAEQKSTLNTVYGAGMAIKRSVLLKATEHYPLFLTDRTGKGLSSGGDSEICLRVKLMGYQILYNPILTFKHFIPGNRLTWSYLKKLHAGFSNSFVILNLYEIALRGESFRLPIFYWFKMGWYYVGIIIKYTPKHYRDLGKDEEGSVNVLHHINWKNTAYNYFRCNFNTLYIYKKIMRIRIDNLIKETVGNRV